MNVDPDNLIPARALNQVAYCSRRPAAPDARPTGAGGGDGGREDVGKMRTVSRNSTGTNRSWPASPDAALGPMGKDQDVGGRQ